MQTSSESLLLVICARPDIYPVCLAGRDDQGGTRSTTATVIVSPAGTTSASPPIISISISSQPVAWDSTTPYNITLGKVPPGRYTAIARASDSNNAATWSAPFTFTVMGEADLVPEPSLSSNQLSLDYYRFTDGTLNYTFERSSDLLNWTPFVPTESVITPGTQVQQRRAIDPLSTSGVDRGFLRIKIVPVP